MKIKLWHIGIAVLVLLILGGVIYSIILTNNSIKASGNSNSNANNNINIDLSKVPEECRPTQGYDIQGWKEHLGHHANTKYCLDYYK